MTVKGILKTVPRLKTDETYSMLSSSNHLICNGLSPGAVSAILGHGIQDYGGGAEPHRRPLDEAIPRNVNTRTRTPTLNHNGTHDCSGIFCLPSIEPAQTRSYRECPPTTFPSPLLFPHVLRTHRAGLASCNTLPCPLQEPTIPGQISNAIVFQPK